LRARGEREQAGVFFFFSFSSFSSILFLQSLCQEDFEDKKNTNQNKSTQNKTYFSMNAQSSLLNL